MKAITGIPGRGNTWQGHGCPWPKVVRPTPTAKEIAARKVASYGGKANFERYKAEVDRYIAAHPGCSTFDIALECHMSMKMARSLKCL